VWIWRAGIRPVWAKVENCEAIDARFYPVQDMFYSENLRGYAFSTGMGAATLRSPHFNYTGDPYWTDGLRLVMWLSAEPISYHRLEAVHWETVPPQ
jgi:hypothetical protein